MYSCFVFLGRIVVFLYNIVALLLGIGVLVAGVLVKYLGYELDKYLSVLSINTESIVIVLIVTGIMFFLLGLSGCIGASCKIVWALIMNASGVSVLLAATIYLLIVVIQLISQSTELFTEVLTNLFYDTDNNGTFHAIEYGLKCCGVNGSDSYESAGMVIPPTCCPIDDDSLSEITEAIETLCTNVYDGCVSVITEYFINYARIVKIVLISIICSETVVVVFDIIIACSGKQKK